MNKYGSYSNGVWIIFLEVALDNVIILVCYCDLFWVRLFMWYIFALMVFIGLRNKLRLYRVP